MKISCHVESPLPKSIIQVAESKATDKFERFASSIHDVSISVRDMNGPKGGNAMQCKITVKPTYTNEIVIEHTATSVKDALQGAFDRAVQNVAKAARKRHQRNRPVPASA